MEREGRKPRSSFWNWVIQSRYNFLIHFGEKGKKEEEAFLLPLNGFAFAHKESGRWMRFKRPLRKIRSLFPSRDLRRSSTGYLFIPNEICCRPLSLFRCCEERVNSHWGNTLCIMQMSWMKKEKASKAYSNLAVGYVSLIVYMYNTVRHNISQFVAENECGKSDITKNGWIFNLSFFTNLAGKNNVVCFARTYYCRTWWYKYLISLFIEVQQQEKADRISVSRIDNKRHSFFLSFFGGNAQKCNLSRHISQGERWRWQLDQDGCIVRRSAMKEWPLLRIL